MDNETPFLILIIVALFMALALTVGRSTSKDDVRSGSRFKLGDAVYKCEKVQELKYDN